MKNFYFLILSFVCVSCDMNNDSTSGNTKMDEKSFNTAIEKVANKKIYFGHQSVGKNIVDGLNDLLREHRIKNMVVLDSQDIKDYKGDMLGHSKIGYNTDPMSKIIGFSNYIDNLRIWKPDIAIFKFCYVDITSKTDIKKIFNQYTTRMDMLKEKYPDTIFIHSTVPLTTVQSGIKAKIKKLIGRNVGGSRSNIVRNKYNALLRNKYEGKEPIFDLAKIESTFPNGERSEFEANGKKYYSLVDIYTYDGRHLNEQGRKLVASKFMTFLAKLPE